MATLVSNKFVMEVVDENNEVSEFSVANINPAITDTSVLKAAAIQIMSLSESTIQKLYLDQRVDITSD